VRFADTDLNPASISVVFLAPNVADLLFDVTMGAAVVFHVNTVLREGNTGVRDLPWASCTRRLICGSGNPALPSASRRRVSGAESDPTRASARAARAF
jgi:hypothetical protein